MNSQRLTVFDVSQIRTRLSAVLFPRASPNLAGAPIA